MKWVFVSVLLINVIYFVYNAFFYIEPNSQQITASTSDKDQLVLLQELDSSELTALKNKISQVEKVLKIVQPAAAEDIIAPEINKELNEPSKENNLVQNNTPQVINLCYTVGPLTKSNMDDIRLKLEKTYSNQLSFSIETTSDITYYRIYIPPLENKDKIKETLALLDKNNLKDHYVMSIDGRKNAIALGVFKKKDAAEKIARIAENVGLSTTIEAISNDKNSLYKLHINFQKTHDISQYNELIEKNNLNSIVCENKG